MVEEALVFCKVDHFLLIHEGELVVGTLIHYILHILDQFGNKIDIFLLHYCVWGCIVLDVSSVEPVHLPDRVLGKEAVAPLSKLLKLVLIVRS